MLLLVNSRPLNYKKAFINGGRQMFKFFTLFSIFAAVSLQISAQCGVYFKESSRQIFSNSFANAAFEDFDGDGLEDLFGYSPTRYANTGSTDFQIHYYKRLAANSFDTTAKVSAITNVRLFIGGFGDVDGDGKKDVVVTHMSGSFLSIRAYLNDGTGSFSTATPVVDVPDNETVFGVSDMNNDGKADVITAAVVGVTGTLYYRLTQPDNSFGARVAISTFVQGMAIGKFSATYGRTVLTYSYPLLIEDLNNDGAKDIALVNTQSKLYVLTNNGSLTFTESFTMQYQGVTGKLKAYDFNNDGKKDFISNADGNGVRFALNNGNNTFTESTLILPAGISSNSYSGFFYTNDFKVADFDNDGDLDVIFPGTKNYAFFRNQGNATFTTQAFKSIISLDALTNLDGDGKADSVALIRPLINGAYFLHDGSNNQYFYRHNAVSFRKNVCDPIGQTKKVDFNGDGFADRTFFNTTNGNWRYNPAINGPATTQVNFQWGVAGDKPVPNDYDGDGVTDYAVFRPSDGTWWIYRSSDNQSYALHFGISEDKPVPADYDGDGRADIAVFRPSTGDWHFFFSLTNQYGAVHFGAGEDKPIPADYDGDGKADVCVFRPSEGNWYRFNSSDYSVFVVHYGVSIDKLVPGDYDGDGKANIAIFRDGVWYVLKDDFSSSIFNWGVTGDEPYFDEGVESRVNVFRRSSSHFWAVNAQFPSITDATPSGNTTNEVLVSSILSPE